jgi:very-short-patch-repair endonuclease
MSPKRKIIPYNPKLKSLAKDLRNNSTLSEVILWKKLKGKQFFGYDFHRQKPILEYIVDFYCSELNLVIEIDGKYHEREDIYLKDVQRQKNLENVDLNFLRFTEKEIKLQLLNVLRAIEIYIEEFEKHTPNPSREGNGRCVKTTKELNFLSIE